MEYFTVIETLHKAESAVFLFLYFIIPVVYQSHDPADRFVVLPGDEEVSIRITIRPVLFLVEKVPFIGVEGRQPIRFPFMDLCRQIDEFP